MAIAYFEAGRAGAGSTNTVTIPISVDVPRSDPILGTTYILVFFQASFEEFAIPTALSDDAEPEDAYSTCITGDGLNHYDMTRFPAVGLIVNDLVAGTNSITLEIADTITYLQAIAVAVTGVGVGEITEIAQAPVGAPTSSSLGLQVTYAADGSITFNQPSAATDEDWDWEDGDLAFYWIQFNSAGSDQLGWTWADGTMDDFAQWDVDPGIGRFMSFAIGARAVVPTLAGPSLLGAWGDASSQFGLGGTGGALKAGPGPVCAPAPTFGNPTFNKVIPA